MPATTATRRPEASSTKERTEDIFDALKAMFDPGQVVELRALGVSLDRYTQDRTFSGYFADFRALAECAAELAPNARGIYVTLNPPHPRLLARCYNRVAKNPKHTTADHEILRRTRLLIDADAQRFSGIPATAEEHQRALDRTDEIAHALAGHGWPEPLRGDSGNGGHLVYAIDLPVHDQGLVWQVLQALAFLFDDEHVRIDTSVYNPARITRLYGTLNRKGDHVPHLDMPHRPARVRSAPRRLEVVPKEALHALALRCPEEPTP